MYNFAIFRFVFPRTLLWSVAMVANCKNYDFQKMEPIWQKKWLEEKIFRAENESQQKKYYVLDMFPYPFGAGFGFGAVDSCMAV